MNDIINEALAAVAEPVITHPVDSPVSVTASSDLGQALSDAGVSAISLAPDKIPAGKYLVAIKLDRREGVCGDRVESINLGRDESWQSSGMAIVLKGGQVVQANYLFGHVSSVAKGEFKVRTPKITACRTVKCSACGRVELVPPVVFMAKDNAKRAGVSAETLNNMSAYGIIHTYGSCPCGKGRFVDRPDDEKAELTAFADEVLREIERRPVINHLLPPRFFSVRPIKDHVPLNGEWDWMNKALASRGECAVPFERATRTGGITLLYNPKGINVGWCDNYDDTNLFWMERGQDRYGRRREAFNPATVDGL